MEETRSVSCFLAKRRPTSKLQSPSIHFTDPFPGKQSTQRREGGENTDHRWRGIVSRVRSLSLKVVARVEMAQSGIGLLLGSRGSRGSCCARLLLLPPPPDAPSIRQMGEGEREGRGLRDSWRRFAISVSLMKASR